MRLCAAVLLLPGCAVPSRLFLEQVWRDEEEAILIVTDKDGRIVAPTPLLIKTNLDWVWLEPPRQVIVHVQTFPELDDRDLDGCSITTDEGEPLGPPRTAWSSGPVSLDGAIQLAQQEVPERFELRVLGCPRMPKSCDVVATQIVAPATTWGLHGAVSIAEDEMLAVGGVWGDADPRTFLIRVQGETAAGVPPHADITGYGIDMENDGTGIVGATGLHLFRLDFDGVVTGTIALGFAIQDLDTGADGTTVLIGKNGGIASVARGSLSPRAIVPPNYRATPTPSDTLVATVDADSFVIYGPDSNLYEWKDGWRVLISGEDFSAIGADEISVLAVPAAGAAILYDRTTEVWSPIGPSIAGIKSKRVTALGDGRYLIVGQNGLVEYYNGEQMCCVASGVINALNDADVAPGGRVAYVVGDNYEEVFATVPSVLRLELPRR